MGQHWTFGIENRATSSGWRAGRLLLGALASGALAVGAVVRPEPPMPPACR
jgi:hypothetical protein